MAMSSSVAESARWRNCRRRRPRGRVTFGRSSKRPVGPAPDYNKTPAHWGYEIQILNAVKTKYPTGSVYLFAPAEFGHEEGRIFEIGQHGERPGHGRYRMQPIFVEDIGEMAQQILAVARDGDVVLTMGAGSIGAVPGKLSHGPV